MSSTPVLNVQTALFIPDKKGMKRFQHIVLLIILDKTDIMKHDHMSHRSDNIPFCQMKICFPVSSGSDSIMAGSGLIPFSQSFIFDLLYFFHTLLNYCPVGHKPDCIYFYKSLLSVWSKPPSISMLESFSLYNDDGDSRPSMMTLPYTDKDVHFRLSAPGFSQLLPSGNPFRD